MLGRVRGFLQGKKTYISAAALGLFAALSWWCGFASTENAGALIILAFGLAGLGAKSERYGRAALAILEEMKKLQLARAAGTKVDLGKAAQEVTAEIQRDFSTREAPAK